MTYEDAIVKMLCEINNRLTDIAITLQTTGLLSAVKIGDGRQEWLNKLSELLQAQSHKYATLDISKD